MILLGFSGRARSGKTTCVEAIAAKVNGTAAGGRAEIYDIGALVLEECQRLGMIAAGKKREELSRMDKEMLQEWGLKRRERDEQYWLRKLDACMRANGAQAALVPNIRYQNEAAWVHGQGGAVVRVVRLNANGTHFISMDRDANHPSETELAFWPADYVLTAGSGPEQQRWLARQAVSLFEHILEAR